MTVKTMRSPRPIAHTLLVTLTLALSACGGGSSSNGQTATNVWSYLSGASTVNARGMYGTQDGPAAGNTPGAREAAASWTDAADDLWLFGGNGYDGAGNRSDLNDLWNYSTATGQWTWMSGTNTTGAAGQYGTLDVAAAANTPGAREGAASWRDRAGNLWLFGGDGFDANDAQGVLSDLWKFDPTAHLWSWVGGSSTAGAVGQVSTLGSSAASNLPGARTEAAAWTDASGNLWLMGGDGLDINGKQGPLNDMWEYSISTGKWALVGGSETINAIGTYGTQGSPTPSNAPGARYGAVAWVDPSGDLWLFGGYGLDSTGTFGELGDLWEFNPSTGLWAWKTGAATVQARGVYGSAGSPAAGNTPGSRAFAAGWADAAGNLWLLGGYGLDASGTVGPMNDLWVYSTATGQWTWASGADVQGAKGVYAATGVSSGNELGSRYGAARWLDASGNLWFLGGNGLDANGTHGALNDLWKYQP